MSLKLITRNAKLKTTAKKQRRKTIKTASKEREQEIKRMGGCYGIALAQLRLPRTA